MAARAGGGGGSGPASPASPGRPAGARSLRGGVRVGEGACPICLAVHEGPVELPCVHGFCRACVLEALGHKRECPLCRGKVPGDSGDPVERYVYRSPRLEDLALRQPVVCPNEGCGITISKKHLADHTRACPHSVAPCPLGKHGCAFVGNKAARDAHFASGECHFKPVEAFLERYERRMSSVEEWCSSLQDKIDELKKESRRLKEENELLKEEIGYRSY